MDGTANRLMAAMVVDFLNELFRIHPSLVRRLFVSDATKPRLVSIINDMCGVYGDASRTGLVATVFRDGELQGFALKDRPASPEAAPGDTPRKLPE